MSEPNPIIREIEELQRYKRHTKRTFRSLADLLLLLSICPVPDADIRERLLSTSKLLSLAGEESADA
jgi:hypothetical protein